jgi:hypothetical protein
MEREMVFFSFFKEGSKMLNFIGNREFVVEKNVEFVALKGDVKIMMDLQRKLRGNRWDLGGDVITFPNDRVKADYWYDEHRPDLNWFKDYSNSEFREKMVELQKHLSLSRWFMCVNTTDHKEFIEWLDEDVDKVKAVLSAIIHLNKGISIDHKLRFLDDSGTAVGMSDDDKFCVNWIYNVDYVLETLEPLGWINKSVCEVIGADPFNRVNAPEGFDFVFKNQIFQVVRSH